MAGAVQLITSRLLPPLLPSRLAFHVAALGIRQALHLQGEALTVAALLVSMLSTITGVRLCL